MIPNYTTPEPQQCLGSSTGPCDRTRESHPRQWVAGRCNRCYLRQKTADRLAAGILCSAAGCIRAALSRGMCSWHTKVALASGALEIVNPQRARGMTLDEVLDLYSEFVPFSTCRYWTGPATPHGYGRTSLPGTHEIWVHRAVWEAANGPIPPGGHVLHTCNEGARGCVELSHLYLGDNDKNVADKVAAGTVKGEGNSQAKLTDSKVAAIRDLADSGLLQREIAGILGVTNTTICQIQTGDRWSHIDAPANPMLVAAIRGLVELDRAPEAFLMREGAA